MSISLWPPLVMVTPMLTVAGDRDLVERQLAGGELACPSCGGVLARWGNAAERRLRLLDGPDVWRMRPGRRRRPGRSPTGFAAGGARRRGAG